MIKKISLLLVALLLLGTLTVGFVGCADTEDGYDVGTSNTVNTQETDDGYIADDLPENNFEGQTVTILTTTFRDGYNYILQTEYDGSVLNEAMVRAYINVSERFNLKIARECPGDQGTVMNQVNTTTLAGDTSFDIVYNCDTHVAANAVNGCFLNINSMELVNLDKPWWTRTSREFQFGGKLYFTASYFGLLSPYMNVGLYYNKQIAETNHIDIPYEDIEAGKWYIEDMIGMTKNMKQDLDGDGLINEDDQYGFVSSHAGNVSAQANLLGPFITLDQKGMPTMEIDTEKCHSYMELMSRIYENGTDEYGGAADYNMDIFAAGRSLFAFTETRCIVEKRNEGMSVSFGMIPFPKYDENQEQYSSAGYDLFFAVNRNVADRSDIIATVLEGMSCQNYNNVLPVIWENILGVRLSENATDYAMVCIVRDATYVNPDYGYNTQILGLRELVSLWDYTTLGEVSSHISSTAPKSKVSLKLFAEKMVKLP